MLSSIKNMIDSFDENQIIYCHWKSNEHLLPALNGDTDLDVLFLPEQRTKLDKVLSDCGLKRFRSVSHAQYNAIEDYIGFDEETGKIWHLHTHYRMTLGEKHLKGYTITPWTEKILNNRVKVDLGIYTSSVEDELILLFVRNAMKLRLRDSFKNIGKDDQVEFDWLISRIDKEVFKNRLNVYLENNSAEEIYRLVDCKLIKKRQLNKLHRLLLKGLSIYTGYTKFESIRVRLIREFKWFVGAVCRHVGINSNSPSRRVSPSGGSVVVFLGCDGAGKSTTIKNVKKELLKKLDVKTVYLGSGDGSSSLLRKPMKFVAKRVGGKGLGHSVNKEYEDSKNSKKKVSLKARLYSVAKLIWADTLANEKRKKLKEITKSRNNGMIVLVDRYPQVDIPGYSDGPLMSKYIDNGKGFLYRKAKKEYDIYASAYKNPPDLTIKLMVPTEIAIQRKPEMTTEEIENKKEAVRLMNPCSNIKTIDTSVDMDTSFKNVMSAIWEIV